MILVYNKKAVLSQGNRAIDATAILFLLKFANNIHYKFKSSLKSQALEDPNIPAQNRIYSVSFKVTCFGVSGKAINIKQWTK